jgi:uncharacterized membrane protein
VISALGKSDPVVITFTDEKEAADVLDALRSMRRKRYIGLQDTVVITKNRNGVVRIHQTRDLTVEPNVPNHGVLGLLVGLTFGQSLGGVVWGIQVKQVMATLIDLGVDDKFMTIIEQTMDNDSSAIFFLMPEQNFRDTDELLVVLNQFSGSVHHTTIPSVAQAYLVKVLADEKKS